MEVQHDDPPLCRSGCGISFNMHILLNLLKQSYRRDLHFMVEHCSGEHLGN